ncbi:hypothetical protein [Maribellus sediminis]|uniref:hypothetical protein n=1 Tax=Maribellus sediminis TaxID=2696285 RepID=UPI00143164B1|nr:hypothetical protein [Maribellus sediminis]
MIIFKKLFGKTEPEIKSTTEILNPVRDEDTSCNVNKELFVNPIPPTQNVKSQQVESMLQIFLGLDYFGNGYKDGYNWHSNELLETRIRAIKADFRMNLGLKFDQVNQDIVKLKSYKIEINSMSEELSAQFEIKLNAKKEILTQIEKEKELSALDEGLVMTCIHKYREGYLQGTNAFMEEKMFASTTGLFI